MTGMLRGSGNPAMDDRRRSSFRISTTSIADDSTTRVTLNYLPEDILHETAGHLCNTSPVSESAQRPTREKHCCSLVASSRLFLGDPNIGDGSLLAFAAVSKRIRAVVFPVWLLRSVVFHLCRERWNRLQCLPRGMRSGVRSLTIETAPEYHTGTWIFSHADVIRYFPNLDDVSIFMCPLRTTDSRYHGLELGSLYEGEKRISSSISGIPAVTSLSICVGHNQYISGNQDIKKIKQLSMLLRQLQLPRLQSLYLEFESSLSFVNWPIKAPTQPGVPFPALESVEIACPIVIRSALQVDICAGVERLLALLESAPHIASIEVQILITIPADQTKSGFWRPSAHNETNAELHLLPGVLPSTEQAMALLARQKRQHPLLRSFSVDVSLSVPNDDDSPTPFEFWQFSYPAPAVVPPTHGKTCTYDYLPDSDQPAMFSVSHDDVNRAEILHENYCDDLREAALWDFGSGLLR